MKRTKIERLVKHTLLENAGVGTFEVIDSFLKEVEYARFEPVFTVRNIKSGWTCDVHGLAEYENHTVDWDYSTNGRFTDECDW